jgi:hypothetical protein
MDTYNEDRYSDFEKSSPAEDTGSRKRLRRLKKEVDLDNDNEDHQNSNQQPIPDFSRPVIVSSSLSSPILFFKFMIERIKV